jgi:hypothetical protein
MWVLHLVFFLFVEDVSADLGSDLHVFIPVWVAVVCMVVVCSISEVGCSVRSNGKSLTPSGMTLGFDDLAGDLRTIPA